MPENQVFRERIKPAETPIETSPVSLEEGVSGADKLVRPLAEHETESGKYILDLFDIQATHKEMPTKIQFNTLNKYVREQLGERNWEDNKKNWQTILSEIENEIGTVRLETSERMKRIFDYIQIKKKYNEIKKRMDSYKIPRGL